MVEEDVAELDPLVEIYIYIYIYRTRREYTKS